jgi:hypothetical protein
MASVARLTLLAYPLRGQVGGGWALEIESLGAVKWHRAEKRGPFGAQKTKYAPPVHKLMIKLSLSPSLIKVGLTVPL